MDKSRIGHESALPSTTWLRIKDLHVRPPIQRKFQPAWAKHIAETMDPDKLGVLHVLRESDGQYRIIDGQHRHAALMILWPESNQRVECKVYEKLSLAEEAELFVGLNDFRRLTPLDIFLANVVAKDPASVEIDKIVRDAECKIGPRHGEHTIRAVGALLAVYAGFGASGTSERTRRTAAGKNAALAHPDLLRSTLKVLSLSWGGAPASFEGDMIEGVGRALASRLRVLTLNELVERLAKYPGGPSALLGAARGRRAIMGGRTNLNLAELVIEQYNKGRRTNKVQPLRAK